MSNNIRVYKLAQELGLDSKELIKYLKDFNLNVKSHMSMLDAETAEIVRHEIESILARKREEEIARRPRIAVDFPLSLRDLAVKLGRKPTELQRKLMEWKVFAHINYSLNEELAGKLADAFGYVLERKLSDEEEVLRSHEQEEEGKVVKRPPIVTLMGHVDHGKTTLLENIRKLELTKKEAGGMTQHIGAYEVEHRGEKITFIDTPGHEAFTAMRARGADVTDIVILVVAADDGVMPQTIEAIDHARAAEVPIIVAINKVDKADANPDKVKKQLSELNLVPEEWGGDTICVNVSALTGQGIDDLLEMILLQAEMMELKANPDKLAKGVVLESRVSKGGPLVSVIVQSGTLRLGDIVLAGCNYGKVRAMFDDLGNQVKSAGPSKAVRVLGLNGTPSAGEQFFVVEDEDKAKEIAEKRKEEIKLAQQAPPQRMSLKDLGKQEGRKLLRIIIKADVFGSLDAIAHSLQKLQHKEEIEFKILHKGIGSVNESDVVLAIASDALVIGFNVGIEEKARSKAREENIEIRLYSIIYDLINDIQNILTGLKEPELEERFLGKAEVKQVFEISKIGKVAGCVVSKGKIQRNIPCRVIRGDKVVYEGRIISLKRFKDDVREVSEGYECGIALENFSDIQENDVIEAYTMLEVKR